MRAHRIRYPSEQHDRDVAFSALELRDVAFGNAGDFGEYFSRHAAQRTHGAHPLAKLFEKGGFGIAGHHPPCEARVFVVFLVRSREATGNIMPERIDSKHEECLSMNYNA